MSATSSSITRSPSTRPTLPSSNVTSFIVHPSSSVRGAAPQAVGDHASCIHSSHLRRLSQAVRIANLAHRLVLLDGDRAVDVEAASAGAFGPDPHDAYERWDAFAAWAADLAPRAGERFDERPLLAPVPRPRQVFALG